MKTIIQCECGVELTFEGDSVKVNAGRVGLMCSKCLETIKKRKSTTLTVDVANRFKKGENDEEKTRNESKGRKGKGRGVKKSDGD